MPIATTGMLVTIAFQVGSSVFSQIYGKRNNDEVKKLQRDAQIDAQKQDFEREMERYHRSCKYQIELEADAHQERLRDIEADFEGAFKKMAHASALNRYPLNISPYLIKKNILNFDSVSPSEIRPDLFCILSCGDEPLFNRDIFPFLDNLLNSYLSCYWNTNTTHRICYYEGLWNRDVSYDSAYVANLQAMLPAPILMVSPRLQKRNDGYKLTFDFNFWGCGESKSINFEPDNLPSLRPQNGKKYSKEEIKDILEKVAPGLICMIGYYADNYYWANYYEQPVLPSLLASEDFIGHNILLEDYRDAYKEMLNLYVKGHSERVSNLEENTVIEDVAEMNNFNFPERACDLLQSITPIMESNDKTEEMINNTVREVYKSKSGKSISSFEDIDSVYFSASDLIAIQKIKAISDSNNIPKISNKLQEIVDYIIDLRSNVPCKVCEVGTIDLTDVILEAYEVVSNTPDCAFVQLLISDNSVVITLKDYDKTAIRDEECPKCIAYKYSELIIPASLQLNVRDFEISSEQFNKIAIQLLNIQKNKKMKTYEEVMSSVSQEKTKQRSGVSQLIERLKRLFDDEEQTSAEDRYELESCSILSYENLSNWILNNKTDEYDAAFLVHFIDKKQKKFPHVIGVMFMKEHGVLLGKEHSKKIYHCSSIGNDLLEMFNGHDSLIIK